MLFNKKFLCGLLIFLAGALAIIALRFALVKNTAVHYHANFALYVNGMQDKFDNFTFYEEVASCSSDSDNPKHRAHLHDNKNHLIHVHDAGVTWGHFFANLGYGLSDKSLTTDSGVFASGVSGKTLSIILNDQFVSSIANREIKSEDVLLINYGVEAQPEIQTRFLAITRDAGTFNSKSDPAACSGGDKLDFSTRLKRTLDF